MKAVCTTWLSGLLRPCSQWPSAFSPLEFHRLSHKKLSTRALLGISSVMSCFTVDSLVCLVSKSERNRKMEMSLNPSSGGRVCGGWVGGWKNKTDGFERSKAQVALSIKKNKSFANRRRNGRGRRSTENNQGGGLGVGVWMGFSGGAQRMRVGDGAEERASIQGNC